jgi:chemotaxis protein CheZ
MFAQRRTFRIEEIDFRGSAGRIGKQVDIAPPHQEILAELKALRALMKPSEQITQQMIESYKTQIAEAQQLKAELDLIYEAINKTKREIATLHVTGFEGPEMARVTHELDAIVGGTEKATDQILAAAEDIDQAAQTLIARLKDDQNRQLVQDTQEHVIHIFEACNFQDLTGQRITKVVATLKFIEEHIIRMMEIWGGIESFKDIAPEAMKERNGDAKLLNGPRLENDLGHASQDEIDALFA